MAKRKAGETKKPKHHGGGPHKKVFDVAPPGRMPAAANSRSVPPSIKPPVPDGQLVPGAPRLRAEDPSEKRPLLEHHRPIELKSPEPENASEHGEDGNRAASTPVVHEPLPPEKAEEPAETTPAAEEIQPPVVTAAPEVPEANVPPSEPLASEPAPVAVQTPQHQPEAPRQEEEPTPGQLAVEQMVQADAEEPAPAHPASPGRPAKSIDDLLAESGAPVLESEPPQGVLVSHHTARHSWVTLLLLFLVAIILAAVTLNFLLDAEVITTDFDLPHTNLL